MEKVSVIVVLVIKVCCEFMLFCGFYNYIFINNMGIIIIKLCVIKVVKEIIYGDDVGVVFIMEKKK